MCSIANLESDVHWDMHGSIWEASMWLDFLGYWFTQLASQSCTILYYIGHRLSSYVVSAPSSCCTCTAQCMCMPVLLHECCTIMARASGYPAVGWQRVISCVAFTAPLRGKTYILQCVASTIGVVMLVLACTPTVPGKKQRLGWVGVCLCPCLLGTSPHTHGQLSKAAASTI